MFFLDLMDCFRVVVGKTCAAYVVAIANQGCGKLNMVSTNRCSARVTSIPNPKLTQSSRNHTVHHSDPKFPVLILLLLLLSDLANFVFFCICRKPISLRINARDFDVELIELDAAAVAADLQPLSVDVPDAVQLQWFL